MCYIASFDIGTTQAKGILVAVDARPHLEKNKEIVTDYADNQMEQNADQWYQAVIDILAYWFEQGILPQDIQLLTFSGQMQDCIPVDKKGKALRTAILYGDSRAGKQAAQLEAQFPIQAVTGNQMDGTLTFPKIVWIKEEQADVYHHTNSFLIGSKDYVIRQLTGRAVTDPTTAATTGMMNAQTKQWQTDWFAACGIEETKLPVIFSSDEIVGTITDQAAKETGLLAGTPVLCGIGDGGSASIGAGVFLTGEMYGYLGTTGWIATPVETISQSTKGLFHLPYVQEDQFLAIAPLMNAGNVHKWIISAFGNHAFLEDRSYEECEQHIRQSDRANNSLLFLPYLNGERFPIQDPAASGCMIGIRPQTTSSDMSCAALEGVAMAMRQAMEAITEENTGALTLIGGGSKSKVWNQIMADVLNKQVKVPSESQFFPAMGAVVLGAKKLGWTKNFSDFAQHALSVFPSDIYTPDRFMVEHYNKKYAKYKMLYQHIKDIF
ncbi:xylulokinase [Shimazuella kribbensis]|uniref:xylulokinase n=1 Tax=Shimazuella kribbensis TaxID=139808 RepID=UPI0003FCD4B6|nr:FGGY family carbohydrate kinase [Shimazuella kribbensis]